jgi:2-octaprenylphenol hydroxylase
MRGRKAELTVLIAGAGPVGLAIAALLLTGPVADRLNLRICDGGEAPQWHPGVFDLRVYALSRASQRLLEQVGAWSSIAARRISAYRRMRVWEGPRWGGLGCIEFDSADIGEPDLGHVVEDGLIREALLERIDDRPSAEISFETDIEAIEQRAGKIIVMLSRGERLDVRLLIAADGAASPVRRMLDLPVARRPYGQRAIVTHVRSESSHEQTAWQRFLPGGPLAFLPLSDGRSSIVWSLPEAEAAALCSAPDGEFIDALQRASAGVLGTLSDCAERVSFPLRAQHLIRYCKRRIVFAGDSAHVVHPLAGQGMNLGMLDASVLAGVVNRAAETGEDPGDLRVLRRYERARKGDNLAMLLAFDCFDRLFRMPQWLAPMRAAGLGAVQRLPLVKHRFMRRALGI